MERSQRLNIEITRRWAARAEEPTTPWGVLIHGEFQPFARVNAGGVKHDLKPARRPRKREKENTERGREVVALKRWLKRMKTLVAAAARYVALCSHASHRSIHPRQPLELSATHVTCASATFLAFFPPLLPFLAFVPDVVQSEERSDCCTRSWPFFDETLLVAGRERGVLSRTTGKRLICRTSLSEQ